VTGPHTHMVYFHGRLALTLTLVYFQGRPTHTCSSSSIFRGDWPSHSHGLFSWTTCPHTYIGLFSRATCPHMFILVYFQKRPTLTLGLFSWVTCPHTHIGLFSRATGHTCSFWSIFRGDRPTHSHGLFLWATCPHTHIGLFPRATCPHTHTVYFHGRPEIPSSNLEPKSVWLG
jgi:hypothetical protein